eukprot:Rmarinus@m.7793
MFGGAPWDREESVRGGRANRAVSSRDVLHSNSKPYATEEAETFPIPQQRPQVGIRRDSKDIHPAPFAVGGEGYGDDSQPRGRAAHAQPPPHSFDSPGDDGDARPEYDSDDVDAVYGDPQADDSGGGNYSDEDRHFVGGSERRRSFENVSDHGGQPSNDIGSFEYGDHPYRDDDGGGDSGRRAVQQDFGAMRQRAVKRTGKPKDDAASSIGGTATGGRSQPYAPFATEDLYTGESIASLATSGPKKPRQKSSPAPFATAGQNPKSGLMDRTPETLASEICTPISDLNLKPPEPRKAQTARGAKSISRGTTQRRPSTDRVSPAAGVRGGATRGGGVSSRGRGSTSSRGSSRTASSRAR